MVANGTQCGSGFGRTEHDRLVNAMLTPGPVCGYFLWDFFDLFREIPQ